jgi:hypothetical protein
MTDQTDRDSVFLEFEWPPGEEERKLLYDMRRRSDIRVTAFALMSVVMLAILGVVAWWAKHH